jgi:hypothetical protein
VIPRRVTGDALKGVDAAQPHLKIGLVVLNRPELADGLGETVSDLRLSINLEAVLCDADVFFQPT